MLMIGLTVGGRPPPDYAPYQGPGGGRRGGRY
jgi:cleavage stimulation factor subunit 3